MVLFQSSDLFAFLVIYSVQYLVLLEAVLIALSVVLMEHRCHLFFRVLLQNLLHDHIKQGSIEVHTILVLLFCLPHTSYDFHGLHLFTSTESGDVVVQISDLFTQ